MYAQLGDIVFDLQLGFDLYDDTKTASYAELSLISGKPRLQRTGDLLATIMLNFSFHRQFCIPEDEYNRLNQKRIDGEVLTLIWGTGAVEGQFVITELKKNLVSLATLGEVIHMTCGVTLKEYYTPSQPDAGKKEAQKNAFATDLNRPLPENVEVTEPSEATDVMDDVMESDRDGEVVTTSMLLSTKRADAYNDVIDKAQAFVDNVIETKGQITGVIASITKLQTALTGKLTANPNLNVIAPHLQPALGVAQAAVSATDTLVASYSTLPNPVETLPDANQVLGVMAQTVSKTADLVNALKNLKAAGQPLAVAIATGQEVDT